MKKNRSASQSEALAHPKKEPPGGKLAQCPFCHSTETELYALFGSMLSTSQYYCKNCRTVFERIKWE